MIKINKGASDGKMLIIIVVALALLTGFIKFQQTPTGAVIGIGSSSGLPTQSVVQPSGENVITIKGQECGSDGLADINVRVKNKEQTGRAEYIAAPVSYVKGNGQVVASLTANGGLSVGYANSANVLECGQIYKYIVINDATYPFQTFVNGKSASITGVDTTGRVTGARVDVDATGTNSSDLSFNTYTMGFANETAGSSTGAQDYTSNTNNAMAQGSTLTLRYELGLNTPGGVFGAYTDENGNIGAVPIDEDTGERAGAYVCIGTNPASFTATDLIISGSKIGAKANRVPKLCGTTGLSNSRSFLTAYILNTILYSQGRQSGTVSLTSSAGDPGDNDNVQFRYVDTAAYRGADGLVHISTADSSNADIGETNRYWEANIT